MKLKKIIAISTIALGLALVPVTAHASIFSWFDNASLNIESAVKGLPLTISTYDNEGQKIDQIKTKSANIHTDKEMSNYDGDGNQKSSVIDIDYGDNRITHVGSTMIAYEGLVNYKDKYAKDHNLEDFDSSTPIINSMYQNFKNNWDSSSKVVVIRSQAGNPVAAFVGNHVSINQTEMKNTTKFTIDDHRLIAYRCDYTVYPMDSLK